MVIKKIEKRGVEEVKRAKRKVQNLSTVKLKKMTKLRKTNLFGHFWEKSIVIVSGLLAYNS